MKSSPFPILVYLGTAAVGRRLGKRPDQVRDLIHNGPLVASYVGRKLKVRIDDLEAFQAMEASRG